MNAFNWRTAPAPKRDTMADKYPQLAYYWRKKAGLTGTRQNPVRGWRYATADGWRKDGK